MPGVSAGNRSPQVATPATAVEPQVASEGQGAAGLSQGHGADQAMQAVMQGVKDVLRRRG